MNVAILLSGGIGARLGSSTPKQYLDIKGKPLFMYSVEKFDASNLVDAIVIVAAIEWMQFAKGVICNSTIHTNVFYANAGRNREESVFNGLKAIEQFAKDDDIVLIHDAVRPMFSPSDIDNCIEECKTYDGAIPVVSVKDATYQSSNGKTITGLLDRDHLFAGQSPEGFRFGPFLSAHKQIGLEDFQQIHGSAEMAIKAGLTISTFSGSERNFKITTIEDLRLFESLI